MEGVAVIMGKLTCCMFDIHQKSCRGKVGFELRTLTSDDGCRGASTRDQLGGCQGGALRGNFEPVRLLRPS